ncbi:hypothetical protein E2986_11597 [Frieseomelitta varia]|uniref:Cytochrome b-c1 complex subunit 7 n=1 Tax=Frieseomelitta varia TaxID=561572 RepID=A0A833S3K6_9HYME|nr:hypothetical protein E2986_11597 [Frieseomelitta varia]
MSKVFRTIRIKPLSSLIKRYRSQIQSNSDDWKIKFKKFMFNSSGFNKYGLYMHDLFDDKEPVIGEALRRQPKELLDGRNFRDFSHICEIAYKSMTNHDGISRCMRASQLDFLKIHLPKEKWITYEQDIEYRYLDPFIEEIMAERMEIYKFGCTNYSDIDWPYFEIK